MYVINVAHKRTRTSPPRHVMRTARDSILSQPDAIWTAKMLRKAFPADQYSIEISRESLVSEYVQDWEYEVDPAQKEMPL